MERISLQARRERLAKLVPRVGPVAFARDRILPINPALEPLLPEGGLVRGSVIGCQGRTAVSVALAAVAEASAAGSWLAVAGMPSLGLRAASEVGIALGRLVMVAEPSDLSEAAWANVMSALIDGFDLIVLSSTGNLSGTLSGGTVRRLQARVQNRGAVLVVVGDPGPFSCDLTLTGQGTEWEGLGHGDGRLLRRRLTITSSGRRSPRPRQAEVWLPGLGGGIEAVCDRPIPAQLPAAYERTG